jgi:hypothetical protein
LAIGNQQSGNAPTFNPATPKTPNQPVLVLPEHFSPATNVASELERPIESLIIREARPITSSAIPRTILRFASGTTTMQPDSGVLIASLALSPRINFPF